MGSWGSDVINDLGTWINSEREGEREGGEGKCKQEDNVRRERSSNVINSSGFEQVLDKWLKENEKKR